MLDYDTTMRIGQAEHQDVLNLLESAGLGGMFTQTGGTNAALEVTLDGGYTLLITDAADTLSWARREHQGWGVGLYPPDQANSNGECLVPLVHDVLTTYHRRTERTKQQTEALHRRVVGAGSRPRLDLGDSGGGVPAWRRRCGSDWEAKTST